jgi:hypothetical protein
MGGRAGLRSLAQPSVAQVDQGTSRAPVGKRASQGERRVEYRYRETQRQLLIGRALWRLRNFSMFITFYRHKVLLWVSKIGDS